MIDIKKKIRVPIFGGRIIIIITDEKNIYEATKRHFKLDDPNLKFNDGAVLDRDKKYGGGVYPVILSDKLTPGLFVHEAKHIVNRIFIDAGVELDRYNDETEAYLLGWIVNRLWEVKIKFEKKKKIEDEKSDRTGK